jgi:hypothetical protein
MTPHTRPRQSRIGTEESEQRNRSERGRSGAGSILPLAHGKDVVFALGTGITASIDGNVHL